MNFEINRNFLDHIHLTPIYLVPAVSAFAPRATVLMLSIYAVSLIIWRWERGIFPIIPKLNWNGISTILALFMFWVTITLLWAPDQVYGFYRILKIAFLIFIFFIITNLAEYPKKLDSYIPITIGTITGITINIMELGFNDPKTAHSEFVCTVYFSIITISYLSSIKNLYIFSIFDFFVTFIAFLLFFYMSYKSEFLIVKIAFPTCLLTFLFWQFLKLSLLKKMSLYTVLIFATPFLAINLPAMFIMLGWNKIGSIRTQFQHDGRIQIWEKSVGYIIDNSLVGLGVGSEKFLDFIPSHPHSFSLQLWLNFGWIGVVLFCILLLETAHAVEKYHMGISAVWIGLFGGLFLIANINSGAWQTWYLALLAIALNPKLLATISPDNSRRAS